MAFSSSTAQTASPLSSKHCCRLSSSSASYFPKFQIPFKFNKITSCPSSISCVLTKQESMAAQEAAEPAVPLRPDSFGRFGKFGGKYVPETLMHALDELETAFKSLATDEAFQKELDGILRDYVGRESPLYFAERLTEHYKRPDGEGPLIYLKREDLNHTGAHKINNAVAQALLAKRLGKKRIIAETGAGQHGVATATVCARFGLECIIYMGAQDMERQALNVFRMRLLGAEVRGVHSGTATLKDATSEAIRDWVTNVETTHYILGSVAGPHPYPMMVREFHAVIGKETRKQALEKWGGKPDVLVACVGGGSNAMGLFHEFVDDKDVRLIGVEAAGFGIDSGKHAATLTKGEVGVLHGAMSYLLQDEDGQIVEPHSISAGLDYPGVGPEHSFLKDLGRAEYYSITDEEALEAFKRLSRLEGIIPALETSHALAYLEKLCPTLPNGTKLVLNCSGRGDKDVHTAIKYLKFFLDLGDAVLHDADPSLRTFFKSCLSRLEKAFLRVFPGLISQGSFLPLFPSIIDLPILVVALEKVEKSSGSLVGSSIASRQKSSAPEMLLALMDEAYTGSTIGDGGVDSESEDSTTMAVAVHSFLSFGLATELALQLCWAIGEHGGGGEAHKDAARKLFESLELLLYENLSSSRLGLRESALGSDTAKFRKSSQSRLLCFVVTAIAKLATYHRELLRILGKDARRDYLGLMNEPAICLSILGPCESPSKGMQKPGTVNWSEGGTKMISHVPFYILGEQEGPPHDYSFTDILPGR